MKRTSKILSCLIVLMLLTNLSWAQNTPIDQSGPGPHLFFDAKNIVVTNGATPTITFDIYMAASQAYVDYLTANGVKFGLQSVDVAYDVDFGTDGTDGTDVANFPLQTVPVVTNSATVQNNQLSNIQAPKTVLGASPAGYDAKFKYTLYRELNSDLVTTTQTKVASVAVTFNPGIVIGTIANGAKIQLRCAATGYGTGLQGSKWGDLSGDNNNQNIVGAVDSRTTPLPVTLLSFDAAKEGNAINLAWSTTEETNSDHFDVQRSANGKEWNTIQTVAAKGKSHSKVEYVAVDNDPFEGNNLYRLHMIDKDGTSAYSRIRTVKFEGVATYMYPNPVSEELTIKAADWNKVAKVEIVGSNGKKVYHSSGKPSPNINVKSLLNGVYLVRLTNTNGSETAYKIVVNN